MLTFYVVSYLKTSSEYFSTIWLKISTSASYSDEKQFFLLIEVFSWAKKVCWTFPAFSAILFSWSATVHSWLFYQNNSQLNTAHFEKKFEHIYCFQPLGWMERKTRENSLKMQPYILAIAFSCHLLHSYFGVFQLSSCAQQTKQWVTLKLRNQLLLPLEKQTPLPKW